MESQSTPHWKGPLGGPTAQQSAQSRAAQVSMLRVMSSQVLNTSNSGGLTAFAQTVAVSLRIYLWEQRFEYDSVPYQYAVLSGGQLKLPAGSLTKKCLTFPALQEYEASCF